jgi:hypothetical protein
MKVTFSPGGRSLVTSNVSGISFWNIASGREMLSLDDAKRHFGEFVFCDFGRYLCGIHSNKLCVVETGMPPQSAQPSSRVVQPTNMDDFADTPML